jgi:hypothetical protein
MGVVSALDETRIGIYPGRRRLARVDVAAVRAKRGDAGPDGYRGLICGRAAQTFSMA